MFEHKHRPPWDSFCAQAQTPGATSALWGHQDPGVFEHKHRPPWDSCCARVVLMHEHTERVLCGGTETLVCLNTNPVHPGCCAYRHGHPPASALWGHRDPGVFEHNIVHSRVLCSCTDSAGTEGLVCLNTTSTTQGLALMMWVLRSSDVGLTDEGKTRVVLCGL